MRRIASDVVGRAWRDLGSWDEKDVNRFLAVAVPTVLAAQRSSVAMTEVFIARFLGRSPHGLAVDDLIGASVRAGTPPEEVYRRPFVTLWSSLAQGTAYLDAVNAGLARATSTAEMDVQMSMRATANAVQQTEEGIFGFQRVANPGACEFCVRIDGAYVKSADAMPLHPRCGCGLEPLTQPHPRAATLPSGVAVHQHGELGPVLTDPAHAFTSASDL